jgi:hypothetical protein
MLTSPFLRSHTVLYHKLLIIITKTQWLLPSDSQRKVSILDAAKLSLEQAEDSRNACRQQWSMLCLQVYNYVALPVCTMLCMYVHCYINLLIELITMTKVLSMYHV